MGLRALRGCGRRQDRPDDLLAQVSRAAMVPALLVWV